MLFPSLWFKECLWRCSLRLNDLLQLGQVQANFFLELGSAWSEPDRVEDVTDGARAMLVTDAMVDSVYGLCCILSCLLLVVFVVVHEESRAGRGAAR